MPTLFERIAAREIPADIVYEDDAVIAFRDLHPVAPVHVLVVPKKPLRDLASAAPEDQAVLGQLMLACAKVAAQEGLVNGFRVVANTGADAGQSVDHLHFHVLGRRKLGWPPG